VTFSNYAYESGFKIAVVDSTRHRSGGCRQQQDSEEDEGLWTITGCITGQAKNVNSKSAVTSTCHAGTIVHLCANETIAIATIGGYYRQMVMKKHFTYWGLYKVY